MPNGDDDGVLGDDEDDDDDDAVDENDEDDTDRPDDDTDVDLDAVVAVRSSDGNDVDRMASTGPRDVAT